MKEFDTLLFSQLLGAREELFETICDRRYTLEERMELCLSLGRRLQKCLDDEEIFGMEEEVQRSRKYREERKRETTDKKSRWKEAGEADEAFGKTGGASGRVDRSAGRGKETPGERAEEL